MTCDDVELELVTQEPLSGAAREHLSGCAACRAFEASSAELLRDAALPPLSEAERAAERALAPRLERRWAQAQARRFGVKAALSLAAAACVGAALASAALWPALRRDAATGVAEVAELAFPEPEPVSADTGDELEAFEVSWPSPQ